MNDTVKILYSLFKVRIGFAITLCALAGIAVTPGAGLDPWQVLVLALAVLLSSASAGAFNQYVERDLDARMRRTRNRPFVTGHYRAGAFWLAGIGSMLLVAVGAAALATNWMAAMYVFLGAFVYGVVYTLWLKRRTPLNIVLGGLAGSFAVLAGAAAVEPGLSPAPLLLAVVLFLWTPPHFWSLAFVYRDDYAAAGVPMLPVVVDEQSAAWIIFGHTLALVLLSLLPVFFGASWIYLLGAIAGGGYFLKTSALLVRQPGTATAMANFRASLLQLGLLLSAAIVDRWLLG
jgi:protoheme IX farnesyltransferase